MSFEFVTFRPPEVIGQADPSMLSAIQAAFPEQDTGTEWYRDSEQAYNPRLQELLRPLNPAPVPFCRGYWQATLRHLLLG